MAGPVQIPREPTRRRFRVVLQPGQTWPDDQGDISMAPFRWFHIENRGAAGNPVYVDIVQQPKLGDDTGYLVRVQAQQELTRNVACAQDAPATQLHILAPASNAAAVALLIETDRDTPIVSQRFSL